MEKSRDWSKSWGRAVPLTGVKLFRSVGLTCCNPGVNLFQYGVCAVRMNFHPDRFCVLSICSIQIIMLA